MHFADCDLSQFSDSGYFAIDAHIPELLVFPPQVAFSLDHKHPLVANGQVILQVCEPHLLEIF